VEPVFVTTPLKFVHPIALKTLQQLVLTGTKENDQETDPYRQYKKGPFAQLTPRIGKAQSVEKRDRKNQSEPDQIAEQKRKAQHAEGQKNDSGKP
jgi:hypothetical protein